VWTVSAIYKSGLLPAVLMFLWFCLLLGFLHGKLFYRDFNITKDVTDIESTTKRSILTTAAVIMLNVVIVTVVNGLYVSSVTSSQYSFETLLITAICLSVFKVVWNYILLKSSQYVVIETSVIILLSLFNNLLAPLLAEMFVSSDCFLYIVTEAPLLTFDYDVYLCNTKVFNGTVLPCAFDAYIREGSGTSISLSLESPFHYSYQCSFALISSYSYVFIFRYVISGLFEPLVIWLMKRIARFVKTSLSVVSIVYHCLPVIWRIIFHLEFEMYDVELLNEELSVLDVNIESGLLRKRFVVLLVTDLSMLICFGALFPPLALVIGLSVIKDVINTRLSISSYDYAIEASTEEQYKNGISGLKDRMLKLRDSINEEILKAGMEIWNGVWYGVVMASWIWAFVLFDTLSSSVGVLRGVWILLLMAISPFVWDRISQALKWKAAKQKNNTIVTLTENPLLVRSISGSVEMRGSTVGK
jgi:hypothetical protein